MKCRGEYHDSSNRLTIHLSDDGWDFHKFAGRMTSLFGSPCELIDGLDGRYWDYRVNDALVVLHAEVFVGVSIHVETGDHDALLRTIAKLIGTTL